MRTASTPSLAAALLLLATACTTEADDSPYARRPAFFRFSPVTAAPKTLFPALGNPGEWCTITISGSVYRLQNPQGMTDTYPLTSLDNYGTTTWVSGLIVGTPTVPEIGATLCTPVTYDLVCPNCFETGGITRAVVITQRTPAQAQCTRCRTTYDLENGGIIISGTPDNTRRLYRYRCTHSNDTFVVHN